MDRLSHGLVAGAVGTLALHAVTYLDMAVRARPASRTPERSVRRLADAAGIRLGPDARVQGLAALLGYAVGVGVGAGYALLGGARLPTPLAAGVLTGAAMLAGNGPMAGLGITDPRRWSGDEWLTDVVPHVAYGLAVAATYRLLERR